jgi:hypothetical protein
MLKVVGSISLGQFSHAEGYLSTALGQGSHAEGWGTIAIASGSYQHVIRYNIILMEILHL